MSYHLSIMRKVLHFNELIEAALDMLDKQHDGYFEIVRSDDYIYIGRGT